MQPDAENNAARGGRGALDASAGDLLRDRFPYAPSFADPRTNKISLSRINDWLAAHGHADAVPDIVDRAHGYLYTHSNPR